MARNQTILTDPFSLCILNISVIWSYTVSNLVPVFMDVENWYVLLVMVIEDITGFSTKILPLVLKINCMCKPQSNNHML